jgi:hypothetical protein
LINMARHPRLTGEALEEAVIEASRCVASRRHMLEPIDPPPGAPRPTFGSLLAQRCLHCGTVRYDKVSRLTGQVLAPPTYDRAPWYEDALLRGREQGADPAWWRARYWETLDASMFLEPEVVVPLKRRAKKA